MRPFLLPRPKDCSTDWRSTTPLNMPAFLNIAEIELSVFARQGLKHNIATVDELCEQVQSWQEYRNQQMATVHWHFTTADARIKLQRLYPTFQERSRKEVPTSDISSLVD